MIRNIACTTAATLLASASASAQQVHVFSDGKPYAMVDELNVIRPRPKDERRARLPLADRPDATAIAEAHAAAFLRCGMDEASYPADKPHAPEELAYFVKDASYIPVPGTSKIILIGEYGRGKAIVDTDKMAVITPQCPAGVRTAFWSPTGGRIVFATQHVDKIDFHGNSRALWTAKFGAAQDLHVVDAAHGEGMRKLMSLADEKVIDVLAPEKADYLWVLSQKEKIDLRSPRKWWRAVSRNAARKSDITLRKVDLQGKTLEEFSVASGVAVGTAHFVRE